MALVSPTVEAKINICKRVATMTGQEPIGLYDYLSILTGQDVLETLITIVKEDQL